MKLKLEQFWILNHPASTENNDNDNENNDNENNDNDISLYNNITDTNNNTQIESPQHSSLESPSPIPKILTSVILIQSLARGFISRRRVKHIKEQIKDKSSFIIQLAYRRYKAIKRMEKMKYMRELAKSCKEISETMLPVHITQVYALNPPIPVVLATCRLICLVLSYKVQDVNNGMLNWSEIVKIMKSYDVLDIINKLIIYASQLEYKMSDEKREILSIFLKDEIFIKQNFERLPQSYLIIEKLYQLVNNFYEINNLVDEFYTKEKIETYKVECENLCSLSVNYYNDDKLPTLFKFPKSEDRYIGLFNKYIPTKHLIDIMNEFYDYFSSNTLIFDINNINNEILQKLINNGYNILLKCDAGISKNNRKKFNEDIKKLIENINPIPHIFLVSESHNNRCYKEDTQFGIEKNVREKLIDWDLKYYLEQSIEEYYSLYSSESLDELTDISNLEKPYNEYIPKILKSLNVLLNTDVDYKSSFINSNIPSWAENKRLIGDTKKLLQLMRRNDPDNIKYNSYLLLKEYYSKWPDDEWINSQSNTLKSLINWIKYRILYLIRLYEKGGPLPSIISTGDYVFDQIIKVYDGDENGYELNGFTGTGWRNSFGNILIYVLKKSVVFKNGKKINDLYYICEMFGINDRLYLEMSESAGVPAIYMYISETQIKKILNPNTIEKYTENDQSDKLYKHILDLINLVQVDGSDIKQLCIEKELTEIIKKDVRVGDMIYNINVYNESNGDLLFKCHCVNDNNDCDIIITPEMLSYIKEGCTESEKKDLTSSIPEIFLRPLFDRLEYKDGSIIIKENDFNNKLIKKDGININDHLCEVIISEVVKSDKYPVINIIVKCNDFDNDLELDIYEREFYELFTSSLNCLDNIIFNKIIKKLSISFNNFTNNYELNLNRVIYKTTEKVSGYILNLRIETKDGGLVIYVSSPNSNEKEKIDLPESYLEKIFNNILDWPPMTSSLRISAIKHLISLISVRSVDGNNGINVDGNIMEVIFNDEINGILSSTNFISTKDLSSSLASCDSNTFSTDWIEICKKGIQLNGSSCICTVYQKKCEEDIIKIQIYNQSKSCQPQVILNTNEIKDIIGKRQFLMENDKRKERAEYIIDERIDLCEDKNDESLIGENFPHNGYIIKLKNSGLYIENKQKENDKDSVNYSEESFGKEKLLFTDSTCKFNGSYYDLSVYQDNTNSLKYQAFFIDTEHISELFMSYDDIKAILQSEPQKNMMNEYAKSFLKNLRVKLIDNYEILGYSTDEDVYSENFYTDKQINEGLYDIDNKTYKITVYDRCMTNGDKSTILKIKSDKNEGYYTHNESIFSNSIFRPDDLSDLLQILRVIPISTIYGESLYIYNSINSQKYDQIGKLIIDITKEDFHYKIYYCENYGMFIEVKSLESSISSVLLIRLYDLPLLFGPFWKKYFEKTYIKNTALLLLLCSQANIIETDRSNLILFDIEKWRDYTISLEILYLIESNTETEYDIIVEDYNCNIYIKYSNIIPFITVKIISDGELKNYILVESNNISDEDIIKNIVVINDIFYFKL